MVSPAQIFANIENAKHSTGPTTNAGKARSRLNALRHGLTSETLVLSPEDAQAYEEFSATLLAQIAPVGALELQHAQMVVTTTWRLHKIPALEANLFALARLEPAPEHLAALADSASKTALLEANALVTHERQFRNLHLQEQRLGRILRHANKELAALQEQRFMQEHAEKVRSAVAKRNAAPPQPQPGVSPIGSVFSKPETGPQKTSHSSSNSRKAAAA